MAGLAPALWWSARSSSAGLFPPESGRLHVDGTTFRHEDGSLFQWRGYSWFLGFLRFCRGDDVTPDLRWMQAHGVNIVRVFGPLPWAETPDYHADAFRFDRLDPFFDLLETHGLRCEFVPGCYRFAGWPAFLQRCYDVAQHHALVIIERVNEPTVGTKPDPLISVNMHGVLSAYGLYGKYYDGKDDGVDPVLDYSTIHIRRDSAWDRKARHAQELQHTTGKPCISDEPAKITEPDFDYPGGKNDPATTPAETVWHGAIAHLYTAGFTLHTEEGKWGRVPAPGMLQQTVAEAVRDQVWTRIDADVQLGRYNGSHMKSSSPVHFEQNVWAYSSIRGNTAVSVRVKAEPSRPVNGWRIVEQWGPGNSIVRLER